MHRLVVADDHPIVFRAVRAALPAVGYSVVAECIDAAATLASVRAHTTNTHPITLVLDLQLPGGGIALLQAMRAQAVPARVLVLSAENERSAGMQALRAGADGFLPKTCALGELAVAIDAVARGKRYYRPELMILAARGPISDDALLGSLSDREYAVLKGLVGGSTNGEIAF